MLYTIYYHKLKITANLILIIQILTQKFYNKTRNNNPRKILE